MFGREGLIKRLNELDELLTIEYPFNMGIEVIIVGGSAMIACKLVPPTRATMDIDVLRTEDSVRKFFDLVDMNDDVNTFLYQMPSEWETRKVEIKESWETLKVFSPSPEDLAVMKLTAGREEDIQDVEIMLALGTVTIEKLESLLADPLEVQVNLDDETWESLIDRLDDVKRRLEKKGVKNEKTETRELASQGAEAPVGREEVQYATNRSYRTRR